MVFGHSGQDHDWKLEADPMSADTAADCDRMVSGMAQDMPEHHELQTQFSSHHLGMI